MSVFFGKWCSFQVTVWAVSGTGIYIVSRLLKWYQNKKPQKIVTQLSPLPSINLVLRNKVQHTRSLSFPSEAALSWGTAAPVKAAAVKWEL